MSGRITQKERVFSLLLANKGQWVTIPQLLELRIVDYRRRIFELREEGWLIQTMPETWKDGCRLSGYKLVGNKHDAWAQQLTEDPGFMAETEGRVAE